VPIDYGNDQVLANVSNLYDARDNDSAFYVATNSLPAYEIQADVVEIEQESVSLLNFEDFDSFTDRYATFVFSSPVPFTTGDLVTYSVDGENEPFMPEGNYFVEILQDRRKVRFYLSPSFIRSNNFVRLEGVTNPGTHSLILSSQSERVIKTQKALVKIPLSGVGQNISIENTPAPIEPGAIAVLTNGVNIKSYDSGDRFYLGPLVQVNPAGEGEGYDVINPPNIQVSDAGVLIIEPVDFNVDPVADRAVVTPVLEGKLEKLLIDPQLFDIEEVFSITVTGGNSRGAILEPIFERTNRSIFFDSRQVKFGGGIDPINELLQFTTNHNLPRGESIIYNNRGNQSIGAGEAGGDNFGQGDLANGGVYFADPINNTTIRLFETLEDLNAGINTVGFTSDKTGFGIQSFDTVTRNRLVGATIVDDGGTFTNRNLKFGAVNVEPVYDWIVYKNHGFNTGETVVYTADTTPIDPLVDGESYLILKIDEDKFRLCEFGPEDDLTFNLDREEFIFLLDNGGPLSTHSIRYPDIVANVSVSFGSTITGQVVATPFIKGGFTHVYVDDGGIYGSDVINFQRNPTFDIQQGEGAVLSPIISNGVIQGVSIQNPGSNYSGAPEVVVEDRSGSGSNASLRAVIVNGEVEDVVILNGGQNYNQLETRITISDTGKNAIFIPLIRPLRVNSQERFGYENIVNGEYSITSYDREIRENVYNDVGLVHSPIIGWANDGNPIYGPFGYEDPNNINSPILAVETSYELDADQVPFRPSLISYPAGFFIEDYQYVENDAVNALDEYNGRYARTPEFPNGVYAYYAGISTDTNSLQRDPVFPYFLGSEFRDAPMDGAQRIFKQETFNFDNRIFRNTFPYAVGQPFAGSEFLDQSYITDLQEVRVTDIRPGRIDGLQVLAAGVDYKVGDNIVFEDNEDNISAIVSEVVGKDIVDLTVDTLEYSPDQVKVIKVSDENVRFYVYPEHELLQNENVIISGLGTELSQLNGPTSIDVINTSMSLFSPIPVQTAGITTDIFVNSIVDNVEPESLISVGAGGTFETMQVINVFPTAKALRVYRTIPYSEEIGIGTPIQVKPNYFEIQTSSPSFDSRTDEVYYFNPFQTIAAGIETGSGEVLNYQIGNRSEEVFVPYGRIYAPNHKFRRGELIELNIYDNDGFSLFANGSSLVVPPPGEETADLYVANVYRDFIGVKTSTQGEEAFITVKGLDNPRYSIRSKRFAEQALVQRVSAEVTTSEEHELENNDIVNMVVKPLGNSGIGTNATVKVAWSQNTQSLVFDPRRCQPSEVDIDNNLITINEHSFVLGDYVLYETVGTPIGGLENNEKYYVLPFDNNRFFLTRTYDDVTIGKELPIDLTGQGQTTHRFSRVNPQVIITKNNDIEFDVTDASLVGKELKFFYDPSLSEIFLNNGIDSDWQVSGIGTAGVSPDARVFVNYSDNNPDILYYGIDVGGYISTADVGAQNNNSIEYRDSILAGFNEVSVVGPTTFRYSVNDVPDKNSFTAGSDILAYSTRSTNAKGGLANTRIINSGNNFFTLPEFLTIDSEEGNGGSVVGITSNIGRPANLNIVNAGWNYSADPTISPRGEVQPVVNFNDSDFVVSVDILSGGKGYQSVPQSVLVDSVSREAVDNGAIVFEVQSSSVSGVNIEVAPTGLSRNSHELFPINNSNGVPIIRIIGVDSQAGVATYTLQTPIFGFSETPFEVGDEVFIENIYSLNNTVTNLNTAQNGYIYSTVLDFDENANPNRITVQYPQGSNIAIGATFQNAVSSIANRKILPQFRVNQETAIFVVGERLSVFTPLGTVIETDLIITESNTNFFKFRGSYDLAVGNKVRGNVSGVIVTIASIRSNEVRFETSTISRTSNGWQDNIGFLNDDNQALPDNDYYQNLSYSIKSPIPFETLIGPVNKLVHPSGLKNFADTSFETVSDVSFGSTSNTSITLDFLGLTDVAQTPLRVDRINYFDFAFDQNVIFGTTNAIRLQSRTPNKRLTDYIEVKTNRALLHDDISFAFLDQDNATEQLPFVEFPVINQQLFARGVLQARNPFTDEIQFTESVFLFDSNDAFTLQKAEVSDIPEFAAPYGKLDGIAFGSEYSLIYNVDREYQLSIDLDFKLYINSFTGGSGPNLQPLELGFIQLSGDNVFVNQGNTEEIYNAGTTDTTDSVALYVQVNDQAGRPSYYEVYGFRLGGDTYQAIYNFDSQNFSGYSDLTTDNFEVGIGTQGELTVDFTNDSSNNFVQILTKSHRFRENFVGVQTYRFLAEGQNPGGEESLFLTGTRSLGAVGDPFIDIINVDAFRVQSVRSVVFIKNETDNYGTIQQLMSVNKVDQGLFDTFTTQYPFITEGTEEIITNPDEVGIGTFGAFIDDSVPNNERFILRFYPYAALPNPGTQIEITGYHECFYRQLDFVNYTNTPLEYINNEDTYYLERYIAPNGRRNDTRRFPLTYRGIPIYKKVFNPNSQIIPAPGDDPALVVFSIREHFFSTGEELIYEPGTIDFGGEFSPIQVTVPSKGLNTPFDLPSIVYPVKRDLNRFSISTSFADASNNIFCDVVDFGTGNGHSFEMVKKLEKSVITIDGVLQAPIAPALLSYELSDVNVGVDTTFIALTGIGTLSFGDLLLVNDEYLEVENVGFGTTTAGPITGTGTFNIVEVERGVVGSIATSHTVGDTLELWRGSFNIVGSDIIFTESPNGRGRIIINDSNIVETNSSYQGRTFLQQQYDQIQVYDDISPRFDGLTNTFDLTINSGQPAIGNDRPGSAVLLINDVYQTPLTDNNPGTDGRPNNYELRSFPATGPGITTVVFTGIQSSNGDRIESEFDINQNQIPRGGLIVSLGSTPGLGYAPLQGARLRAFVDGTGAVVGVQKTDYIGVQTAVRWATYDNRTGDLVVSAVGDAETAAIAVSDADYNNVSGTLVVTTAQSLAGIGVSRNDIVVLADLNFECSSGGAPSQQLFPDENDTFIVNQIIDDNTFRVDVGPSTIPHTYISGGTFQKFAPFEFGLEHQNPKATYLSGLGFTCDSGTNNQFIFPDKPGGFGFNGAINAAQFSIPVGISTIEHFYDPTISVGVIGEYNVLNGGSGYRGTVDIPVIDPNGVGVGASIIGIATDGGILDIQIIEPGSGYSDELFLDPPTPNYSNLPTIGAFRRSIGVTTITGVNLFVTCEVGSAATSVGIASTLLQVRNFEITNQGYGFFPGDVIEVVGLVTAFGLSQPIAPFQLTVIDTFSDNFSAWSFGQLDYIDSIQELQDGERTRFPLQYEGDLLSFERGSGEDSQSIDLDSIVLIFVNSVLQEPGKSYVFEGGTSFEFFLPPLPQDRIDVYFYRGKEGIDSVVFDDINETVREGDDVQLLQNHAQDGAARKTQNIRRVTEILSSDTVATPLYLSRGDLTSIDPRPLAWDKQKRDVFIYGEAKAKTRDSIEPIIRPTAKIIRTVDSLSRTFYLNTAELFVYENSFLAPPPAPDFSCRVYQTIPSEFRPATASAIVTGDEVTSYIITDPGIGYPSAPTISVSAPVGYAQTQADSRATATATIDANGSVTSITPVGLGSFYDDSNPPRVLIDENPIDYEDIPRVNVVQGFSGIITGITTTAGIPGVSTQGLQIQYKVPVGTITGDLVTGDAIVLLNTTVGQGGVGIATTSTTANPVVVGVGSEFLDNVYVVSSNTGIGIRGVMEVQLTGTDLTGVDNTFGEDIGNFSWGRFDQMDRSIEASLNYDVDGTEYTPGMENYPTVVRTSTGLRNKGGLGRLV
jgi:hypothetical protein